MDRLHANQVSRWTAARISARLGISTAIYQKIRLGAQQIADIRQAGIARIEILLKPDNFDCASRFQVDEVLGECKRQGVTVVSVHGRLKIPYGSEDEDEKKFVLEESLAGIRFAEEAGASIYVAHFSNREHSRDIITKLLDQTDGYNIKLTTENMGALPPYMKTVDEVKSDRFGITVDIGHPRDKDGVNPFVKLGRARQAMAECGNRVFHVHLHETFNLEQKADHRPPMHEDGIIEWGEIFAAFADIGYSGELLFEDGRGENPEEWTRLTAAFPKAFMGRYGNGGR